MLVTSSCDQPLKSSQETVLYWQLVEQLTNTYGLSDEVVEAEEEQEKERNERRIVRDICAPSEEEEVPKLRW